MLTAMQLTAPWARLSRRRILRAGLPTPWPEHPLRQLMAWASDMDGFLAAVRAGDERAYTLDLWGHGLVVVFTSEEARRVVIQGSAEDFGHANDLAAIFVGPASLLLLDGERHAAARRRTMAVISGDGLSAYGATMLAIADGWIDGLEVGSTTLALEGAQWMTLDVILQTVFGMTPSPEYDALHRLARHAGVAQHLAHAGQRAVDQRPGDRIELDTGHGHGQVRRAGALAQPAMQRGGVGVGQRLLGGTIGCTAGEAEAWMARFLSTVRDYLLRGSLVALKRWSSTHVPTVAEYLPIRMYDSAVLTVFTLMELINDAQLPAELYDHPYLCTMRRAAAYHIIFVNDLVSYHKEVVERDSVCNMVRVLQTEEGIPLEQALRRVKQRADEALARFLASEEALAREVLLTPKLVRYIDGLKAWVGGNVDFSITSPRFRWPV